VSPARYEFKYLVTPEVAERIGERAAMFMECDGMGTQGTYRVTSLYLDRWDWMLARQTWEGLRERFKLRLRYYDESDDTFFAEVKLRIGNSISKLRQVVSADVAHALAEGAALPADAALEGQFRTLSEKIDAQPRLWVRYQRQAFVSPWGDGSRLTFDTELEVQIPDGTTRPDPGEWSYVALEAPVVVEMKFNGAFPKWMQHVSESLGLRRTSCSKYAQGAELLGDYPWALGA